MEYTMNADGVLTYIGFDGGTYEVPWKTCRHCGAEYQSHFDLQMGCPDCIADARKRGWKSAQDWADEARRNMIAEGIDPDGYDEDDYE